MVPAGKIRRNEDGWGATSTRGSGKRSKKKLSMFEVIPPSPPFPPSSLPSLSRLTCFIQVRSGHEAAALRKGKTSMPDVPSAKRAKMSMAERLEYAQSEAKLVPSRSAASGNRTFKFTPADEEREQGQGKGKGRGRGNGKGQKESFKRDNSGRQGRSMRGLMSEKQSRGRGRGRGRPS
eukprot:763211-Hanusia_phi.AAC.3